MTLLKKCLSQLAKVALTVPLQSCTMRLIYITDLVFLALLDVNRETPVIYII